MAWWKPRIRQAKCDPERTDKAAETAAEQLAEALAREGEVADVTASLRRQRNRFADEVEAAFRKKRAT